MDMRSPNTSRAHTTGGDDKVCDGMSVKKRSIYHMTEREFVSTATATASLPPHQLSDSDISRADTDDHI